jgi:hypothetical protein
MDITDLEATLKGMEHLARLEELDLSGNPLANEVLKKKTLT